MTLVEYGERMERLLKLATEKTHDGIITPAANRMLATIKNRIQQKGENTDGSKIGQYSKKKMWATREMFDKVSAFKPTPDNGAKKKGKSIKKTMYLKEGYYELRNIQGKNVGYIDYTYRGDLMLSFQLMNDENKVVMGFNKESEALKREGLEERFGIAFSPSKQEIEDYKEEVEENFKDSILALFNIIRT